MTRPAVAIVNWNGGDDLVACLRSIERQTLAPDEVVLVDNGSTDGSADRATAAFPALRRIDRPDNPGYGGAANAALNAAGGDPFVVLNPDVELDPDFLRVVADAFAADPRLGAAGGKLLYPNRRTVQHAGGIVRRPLMLADHRHYGLPDDAAEREPVDVDYVTGAALVLRRAAVEAVGGFDERFFLYYEETDLCRRLRCGGWGVRYLPNATAVHHESRVTGRDSAGYYRRYHHGRIRYALKHLTPTEFLNELVPAERARLPNVVSLEELSGLRHAFADHVTQLVRPDGGGLGAAQPELRPALADALAGLAERAIATTPSGLAASSSPSRLRGRARVEPRPFRSDAPLVGPAVARVREAWNWMSTRWYLAPILEQQNAFNTEVVEALERIEHRLAALERRVDLQAGWLAEIDRDLVALARRVAAGEGNR